MSLDSITPDTTKKITEVIDAGEAVLSEIDMLKDGLRDTVSNLAEELGVEAKEVQKAIRLSYKNRSDNAIEKAQKEMNTVEILLHAAGKL